MARDQIVFCCCLERWEDFGVIRNVCKNLYVSHLLSTTACAGAAAFSAEPLKQRKYSSLVGNIVLSRGSIHLGVILSTLQGTRGSIASFGLRSKNKHCKSSANVPQWQWWILWRLNIVFYFSLFITSCTYFFSFYMYIYVNKICVLFQSVHYIFYNEYIFTVAGGGVVSYFVQHGFCHWASCLLGTG